MYEYVRAVAISRSIGAQWEPLDISQLIVYDLYSMYSDVCVELSNSYLDNNVYIDLNSIRSTYKTYSGTFTELLIEIGDNTLEYIDSLPSTTIKYAKYSEAIQSAYKLDICKIGYPTNSGTPDSELTDIVISRPNYDTDMSLLHSHCLVSVNGYFHMTDTDGKYAYIKDGNKSLWKSNGNHVGILSFLDIGKLSKISLDPSKIRPKDPDGKLKDGVYIDLDVDLTGKSYFLVLGGYLIFQQDGVLWSRGSSNIALGINAIPFADRIYESSNYLDISDLRLTTEANNPSKLSTTELYSDDVIRRYLTMSQSYLVVVDIANLGVKHLGIRSSGMPGKFTCYEDPSYPMVVGHGKCCEYWKVEDGGRWMLSVVDSYKRNYVFDSVNPVGLKAVSDQLNSQKPFAYSRGHLLEIAGWF